VRTGLWMGVSAIFISKMLAWSQPRYSLGWWIMELIQIGVGFLAFVLIMRRIALLEGRVNVLENKLGAISFYAKTELTKAKNRMLEWVA
jgi:hypothetical protein